uniref:Uncharacterized protein n=1 Tax=Lepeophtheirus salmonis TaxID=72036 RepID=A0A0K2VF11_LEPSM
MAPLAHELLGGFIFHSSSIFSTMISTGSVRIPIISNLLSPTEPTTMSAFSRSLQVFDLLHNSTTIRSSARFPVSALP